MEKFLKHFALSGLIVGFSAILIENNKHELSGFLYGGLPIGFLYLLFVANMSRDNVIGFSRETYIGGIYFLLYTFLIYLLSKYTKISIITCIIITTIIFMLSIFVTKKELFLSN
jgi:hypothetical protein